MKVGIFGGAFNPPHFTHLNIAAQAVKQLSLDKLLVIPTGDPPHKSCDVDKYARLHMTELAFRSISDKIEVWDYEVTKSDKSYTVQTLRKVQSDFPQAELFLIIGGDSLKNFGKWYCPDEIAAVSTIVVADRGRKTSARTIARIRRDYKANIIRLDMPADKISSTEIRLRYQFGMDNSEFVPQSVNEYITDSVKYAEYRDITAKIQGYLTPERFRHTFYVVKRGLELASEQEHDKVFTACLLHDVAKYIKPDGYAKYGFKKPVDMPNSVVHAFLGAEVAKRDFGITDSEILDAICYHSTAKPEMSRLAKILYVADKTEQTRNFPTSHLLKGSLETKFKKCLKKAYEFCADRHDDVYCLSKQAVEYYCPEYAQQHKISVDTHNTNGENMNKNTNGTVANETVKTICKFLADKSAQNIKIVEIKGMTDIADHFIICSGRSAPQVKAIFEHMEEEMEKLGKFALRKEGMSEGRWIAVDYGDVIVHIFHKETRELYALDSLWDNGRNVTVYE